MARTATHLTKYQFKKGNTRVSKKRKKYQHKVQVMLSSTQYLAIKQDAKARGISTSKLLREIVLKAYNA